MNINTLIRNWIAASNAFDTEKYLEFYLPEAILDDPSVGRKFEGHKGIKQYFDNYFIGYNTHTELIKLNVTDEQNAYLEVQFTGDFPEGKIGGTFDFRFKGGKIAFVKADLIHQNKNNKVMSKESFDEIIRRSLAIRKRYHELEVLHHGSEWTIEEDALAYLTDAGLVGRNVMSEQQRWPKKGSREELEHKLGENIWWLIVLAERSGVDIEEAVTKFLNKTEKLL